MADSNITKKALAESLKELMEEMPFEKINVVAISERCGMNRKSFYYHFKDKYDLVNWIFDIEFTEITSQFIDVEDITYESHLAYWERECTYFYENRKFYAKVLQMRGQNSFPDHFRDYIRPLINIHISKVVDDNQWDEFSTNFFVDACYCAIVRWLTSKDCITPHEFIQKVDKTIHNSATVIQKVI